MNIPNNKRKRDSQEKIERIFIELIQTKELSEITVSDICKKADLNRSTFYANYIDVYDLADKIKDRMMNDFFETYKEEALSGQHSYDFLKLFRHIKDNQIFYKTYFKLGFDLQVDNIPIHDSEIVRWFGHSDVHTDYHVTFFKAGLNAMLKKWLNSGCKETPEEINEILISEYKKMKNF